MATGNRSDSHTTADANSDTDGDTNPDSDADSYADADGDTDANSDAHADSNTYSDTNANFDAYPITVAIAVTDGERHSVQLVELQRHRSLHHDHDYS